jgi:hypothetical protein
MGLSYFPMHTEEGGSLQHQEIVTRLSRITDSSSEITYTNTRGFLVDCVYKICYEIKSNYHLMMGGGHK